MTKTQLEDISNNKKTTTIHYCSTEKKKSFTYRNFPHHLLLAAAGISGGPITVSSDTLTAPETAHNPETAPQRAVCRTAPRPQFTTQTGPFSAWPSASSQFQTALFIRGKNRSWLNDYLRKASLNLIRQSVASLSARETAAAAPPAESDMPSPHTNYVYTCCILWLKCTQQAYTHQVNTHTPSKPAAAVLHTPERVHIESTYSTETPPAEMNQFDLNRTNCEGECKWSDVTAWRPTAAPKETSSVHN